MELQKTTKDVENKFTSVGNIGLTITNFGTLGTRNNYWPTQPSCEYPRGSRIEHIYQGGIWIGAQLKTKDSLDYRNGLIFVSTAASDRTARSSLQNLIDGYEFNSAIEDSITEYSILSDDRPPAAQYLVGAVSHQDFVSEYSDKFTRVPATGDTITNHIPMGLKIHQESYAWNFPFADFFVILKYTIYNTSVDTLDSVYVGFWNNATVRNTNLVRPGTPGYFIYTGQGFDLSNRMAYSFDYSGTPGGPPADSYIGLKLLGTTPFPYQVDSLGDLEKHTFYNAWEYRLESTDPTYNSPQYDYSDVPWASRYTRLKSMMDTAAISALRTRIPARYGYNYLLSTGPFNRLNPGDSVEVVYAVVCAKKYGTFAASNDLPIQRKNLYTNSSWAQKAYNGEDLNGNNILEEGEDIAVRDSLGLRYEPDGKITRYLLPAPPRKPKVHAEVFDQNVVLYWDKSAEESIDPVTGEKDFEGYRISRSGVGEDFLNHDNFLLNASVVGDFDIKDSIGYDTGLKRIELDSPVTFPGDSVKYYYRFPPADAELSHLNGWQYVYGISAYDRGDTINNVPPLESAKAWNRVIPGTTPTSDKSVEIGVYPNPYYVNAYWDGDRERLRKIYFYNLPAKCEIRVYTLAGDVVTIIQHDASTYNGDGIDWFTQFGDPNNPAKFAGGEHAWNLITRYDQAIATGLYLFTVEDKATGDVKRGKFLIIK
ncbi:MAG: hypothetical protein HY964_00515 [Ignavibacteriales bacterium]|nr:hypothetical protein [Ignavibacteriales bacterium]